MAQRTAIWEQLSDEKKEKYVKFLDSFDKDVNLKAFYKGHDYARKINPKHLDLLDEKTRKIIEEIDLIRKSFKEKEGDSHFGDDDVLELLDDASQRSPATASPEPTKTPPASLGGSPAAIFKA